MKDALQLVANSWFSRLQTTDVSMSTDNSRAHAGGCSSVFRPKWWGGKGRTRMAGSSKCFSRGPFNSDGLLQIYHTRKKTFQFLNGHYFSLVCVSASLLAVQVIRDWVHSFFCNVTESNGHVNRDRWRCSKHWVNNWGLLKSFAFAQRKNPAS